MRAATGERTIRELARLCARGRELPALCAEAVEVLRRAIPFDRACWYTIDPATHLVTGGVAQNLPVEGHRALVRYEYETEDVNSWSCLAGCLPPVGILSRTTRGSPEASRRFRELLVPMGVRDELRAALVCEGACWGALGLYRDVPGAPFDEGDGAIVARSAPVLAGAFRRSALRGFARSVWPSVAPGVVVVDERGEALWANDSALELLGELGEAPSELSGRLPLAVVAVVARARSGVLDAGRGRAHSRVFSPAGGLLALDASRLAGERGERTAVVIEHARPAEVTPLILEAYALSAREREVLEAVLEGLSTKAIAARLHIVAYTVQDHLQAIYKKADVKARRELVAQIHAHHRGGPVDDRPPGEVDRRAA